MGTRTFALAIFSYLSAITPSPAGAESSEALRTQEEGPYATSMPHYIFADTLEAQKTQLKHIPEMQRLTQLRRRSASDPYRPTFHFSSPEGHMNDPNGLSYWQGRWHLFYQSYFADEESPILGRGYWGHAVSTDLVHWQDLPYAIHPSIEKVAFSGSTVVEKGRVVAFYPGLGAPGRGVPGHPELKAGQMVAISSDPLLLNWRKVGPVNTDVGDADIWKEGDTYFGLLGGMTKYYPQSTVPVRELGALGNFGHAVWPKAALWTSKDLITWRLKGELLAENTPFTDRYDDGSCPNFLRIGDKYILLYFSHVNGGQYLLGDYDAETHKFRPYDHGRFNHGQVMPGGVHAPTGSEDGEGGVISIHNINEGRREWDRIMSLPQRLTLGEDKRLRIAPIETIAELRSEYRRMDETTVPPGHEMVLPAIAGNTMELFAEIDPKHSHWVQLNVLRSPDAQEHTSITLYNLQSESGIYLNGRISEEVVLDSSQSSIRSDVKPRSPEKAAVRRQGENLKLRIFIDRSVIEVFVNGQQYLAMRVYPARRDSLGVSIRAHGQEAVLKRLDAWQMVPIWPATAVE